MSYWHTPVSIGSLSFPRFMGGPLDGITDAPFRQLVRAYSKDELLYTEMRHVRCVAHDRGGARALHFEQMERPLNFQVSANSVECIERACERITAAGVDCVDLNIGCPARSVVKSCSGSALMAHPEKLKAILTAFRKHLSIPFTLKMRAGFKSVNAVDIAQLAQDCGVDAIAIHPRLQTQRFSGRPDYGLAALVKHSVSVPVLLSGGIVNWATAKRAYEQTGADGFLIGRGMWAKPWKLKELSAHAQGETYMPSREDIYWAASQHLSKMILFYGDHGLLVFRKHLPFYIRGAAEASLVRQRLTSATSVGEVQEGLKLFLRG